MNDETYTYLRMRVEETHADLHKEAERAFEEARFPAAFATRLIEMLDAFIEVAAERHASVYVRGLHEGRASATYLERQGFLGREIVESLATLRTPFFFERLPGLVPPADRAALIQSIGIFIAGYVRGLNTSDEVTSRRRLGLAVRRITTASSLDELERVVVSTAGDLLEADFAIFLRREGDRWTIAHQRNFDAELSIEGEALAALMSGESVADYNGPFGSTLAAPIVVEGTLNGTIVVGYKNRATFYPEEYATLEILAAQAAATTREKVAIEQLRTALQRQTDITIALQQAFLPHGLPNISGVSFDAAYVPAENDALVGGDWYDAYELPHGVIAFSIGDVTGHGVDAAARMHQLRQAIFVASLDTVDPAEVLRKVNRGVVTLGSGLATAIVGFIDQPKRVVRYAIAGHPPPIHVGEGGVSFLPYGAPPLGIHANMDYFSSELRWTTEAALVLYTDGIIEACRDAVLGETRLGNAVSNVMGRRDVRAGEAAAIYDEVVGGTRAHDDVALLIIRLGIVGERPIVPIDDPVAWALGSAIAS